MTITDYLHVLRKRWRIIALCVLLALASVSIYIWRATPKYQATAQLFVSANDTGGVATGLQSGAQFSQDRVQSYADIVNTRQITDPVAAELNVGLSGKQISSEVSANAPVNTVLLNVTVTDTSARRAQQVANAVGDEFANYATQLEATSAGSSAPVKVTVVKRATVPSSPASPKVVLDYALAVLAGLLVGLAGAILRETLDTTIKDSSELQHDLNLPTLGAIAYDPDAPKRPLVVQADPRSPRSEAFRQLRTNLQFLDVDQAPRSLVVSSSVPEEGKTTTATNLAITMAQAGRRVILVEGDLRRPRLAEYLGIERASGLTSVLMGRNRLDEVIQPWGDGQLSVLPSGPTPPNPSELLGSQSMAEIIKQLEQDFDYVLIDAPPLLPVTDAAVLAKASSGSILVVRHGHTTRKQLGHAVGALRAVDATVYGAILSMVPTKGPDAYYYGYNYQYYRADGPVAISNGESPSGNGEAPSANGQARPREAAFAGVTVVPAEERPAERGAASDLRPEPFVKHAAEGSGSPERVTSHESDVASSAAPQRPPTSAAATTDPLNDPLSYFGG